MQTLSPRAAARSIAGVGLPQSKAQKYRALNEKQRREMLKEMSVDEKQKAIQITEAGMKKAEAALGLENM